MLGKVIIYLKFNNAFDIVFENITVSWFGMSGWTIRQSSDINSVIGMSNKDFEICKGIQLLQRIIQKHSVYFWGMKSATLCKIPKHKQYLILFLRGHAISFFSVQATRK